MNGRSSPTHPTPNTYKTEGVQKPPRQPRGLEGQEPPPKVGFLTPGLGSFPVYLQAPRSSPSQLLLVQRSPKCPQPGLRWGLRLQETAAPQSQCCLLGPLQGLRARTPAQRTQGRRLLQRGEEAGT